MNVHPEKLPLRIHCLNPVFSICRLEQLKPEYLMHPFAFSAVTDEEISLVVPEEYARRCLGMQRRAARNED